MAEQWHRRKPRAPAAAPRRVRGGVRLADPEWPIALSWPARAWIAMAERAVPRAAWAEGLAYAQAGQTRTFNLACASGNGLVSGEVQGRADRPYRAAIHIPPFSDREWDSAIRILSSRALFTARLLSGELPDELAPAFAEALIDPFPADPAGCRASCTCADFSAAAQGAGGYSVGSSSFWCKHLACIAILAGEALTRRPALLFTLRGLSAEELLDRITRFRSESRAESRGRDGNGGPAPANIAPARSAPQVPGVEQVSDPLDAHLEDFWSLRASLDELETPLRAPEVSHALLRRLGPSPFPEAKFPLVGLLATCYDVISESVLRERDEPPKA